MIYLDNAATTYPKPPQVRRAVAEAMVFYGANPGRGGHDLSLQTAQQVYACRETVASLFGLDNPAQVVFTANCTMALNFVIKGTLRRGQHAVVSDVEHNSVVRPLEALKSMGVTYTTVPINPHKPEETALAFAQAIQPNTGLIVCTHASNVLGYRVPIEEIAKIAARRNIPFAVDAAQSGGILPIDMAHQPIDYVCLPGHKGLYGPMGTGLLLCRGSRQLATLIEGGSGTQSFLPNQPEELPERLESGTLNVPGICGLNAGVQWLKKHGIQTVAMHETRMMQTLYDRLMDTPNIRVYTERPDLSVCVPMITVNVKHLQSEQTAALLNQAGIATRAGLHCAPSAHRRMGTTQSGAVRFCPSAFTTRQDVEYVYKKLLEIARNS